MDNNQNYNQGYDNQGYDNQQYTVPQGNAQSVPQYNTVPQNYGEPQPAEQPGKTLAIVSLVSGILSFVCCGTIASIVALICGILSKKKQPENNGMATAGIILGAIGIALSVIAIIVYVILLVVGVAGAAGASSSLDALGSSGYYYY